MSSYRFDTVPRSSLVDGRYIKWGGVAAGFPPFLENRLACSIENRTYVGATRYFIEEDTPEPMKCFHLLLPVVG